MSINFDLSQMNEGSSGMNKSATQFDDIVEDLDRKISGIINQGFLGQARDSYAEIQGRWTTITTELNNNFANGSRAVNQSAANMSDADRRAAGNIGSTAV